MFLKKNQSQYYGRDIFNVWWGWNLQKIIVHLTQGKTYSILYDLLIAISDALQHLDTVLPIHRKQSIKQGSFTHHTVLYMNTELKLL